MGSIFILFFIVLIILAAAFRADFVLIILYLMAGAGVFSHWWSRKAARAVRVERVLVERAFYGETIDVRVAIKNTSRLPVLWLQARETLPSELSAAGNTQQALSLAGRGRADLEYRLDCKKRGYYAIGPLTLFSGDFLGLSRPQTQLSPASRLTVFPKIIPLVGLKLPMHSPLGTLRHTQPIFEDPSRARGKRDYVGGDSLRRVDWKASAASGKLQVKLFEPSIAMETMIFLNMNQAEYGIKERFSASELAVTTAASIADWTVRARQAIGLATNGADPLAEDQLAVPAPPRSGRGALMRLLELLARVQTAEGEPLVELIQREMVQLAWGSSLIVITNRVSDELFETLFQARRRGLEAILIVCGAIHNYLEIEHTAASFNFPIFQFLNEQDLDVWRT